MKVYLNEQHVERRSSVGKWASLLGLAILASGFVISLKFPNMLISFGSLAVGFILSNVGIYYANRYTRQDRPDALLSKALKGLDNRYALYQFLLPSPQVLREPGGLTVLVLKPQDGIVLYQDGKWRNKMGWSRAFRWIGQEGLGRPEQEVGLEVESLKDWLQEQAPDLDVPVRGVLVFTQADLQTPDEPPVPAMDPKQIKGWLRKAGKLPPLPQPTLTRLIQVLDEAILLE
jgi:hypothetical protein